LGDVAAFVALPRWPVLAWARRSQAPRPRAPPTSSSRSGTESTGAARTDTGCPGDRSPFRPTMVLPPRRKSACVSPSDSNSPFVANSSGCVNAFQARPAHASGMARPLWSVGVRAQAARDESLPPSGVVMPEAPGPGRAPRKSAGKRAMDLLGVVMRWEVLADKLGAGRACRHAVATWTTRRVPRRLTPRGRTGCSWRAASGGAAPSRCRWERSRTRRTRRHPMRSSSALGGGRRSQPCGRCGSAGSGTWPHRPGARRHRRRRSSMTPRGADRKYSSKNLLKKKRG